MDRRRTLLQELYNRREELDPKKREQVEELVRRQGIQVKPPIVPNPGKPAMLPEGPSALSFLPAEVLKRVSTPASMGGALGVGAAVASGQPHMAPAAAYFGAAGGEAVSEIWDQTMGGQTRTPQDVSKDILHAGLEGATGGLIPAGQAALGAKFPGATAAKRFGIGKPPGPDEVMSRRRKYVDSERDTLEAEQQHLTDRAKEAINKERETNRLLQAQEALKTRESIRAINREGGARVARVSTVSEKVAAAKEAARVAGSQSSARSSRDAIAKAKGEARAAIIKTREDAEREINKERERLQGEILKAQQEGDAAKEAFSRAQESDLIESMAELDNIGPKLSEEEFSRTAEKLRLRMRGDPTVPRKERTGMLKIADSMYDKFRASKAAQEPYDSTVLEAKAQQLIDDNPGIAIPKSVRDATKGGGTISFKDAETILESLNKDSGTGRKSLRTPSEGLASELAGFLHGHMRNALTNTKGGKEAIKYLDAGATMHKLMRQTFDRGVGKRVKDALEGGSNPMTLASNARKFTAYERATGGEGVEILGRRLVEAGVEKALAGGAFDVAAFNRHMGTIKPEVFSRIYKPEHAALIRRIGAGDGGVIAELEKKVASKVEELKGSIAGLKKGGPIRDKAAARIAEIRGSVPTPGGGVTVTPATRTEFNARAKKMIDRMKAETRAAAIQAREAGRVREAGVGRVDRAHVTAIAQDYGTKIRGVKTAKKEFERRIKEEGTLDPITEQKFPWRTHVKTGVAVATGATAASLLMRKAITESLEEFLKEHKLK